MVNTSPIEIRVPDKPFHPNDLYVFPKRVFGKQNRFCSSKWFKLYSWLGSDEISDSVTRKVFSEAVAQTCSVRKLFLEISQNSQENTCARVSILIKLQASGLSGYSDWKHALSSFDEHRAASYHRFPVGTRYWGDISFMLDLHRDIDRLRIVIEVISLYNLFPIS